MAVTSCGTKLADRDDAIPRAAGDFVTHLARHRKSELAPADVSDERARTSPNWLTPAQIVHQKASQRHAGNMLVSRSRSWLRACLARAAPSLGTRRQRRYRPRQLAGTRMGAWWRRVGAAAPRLGEPRPATRSLSSWSTTARSTAARHLRLWRAACRVPRRLRTCAQGRARRFQRRLSSAENVNEGCRRRGCRSRRVGALGTGPSSENRNRGDPRASS